jgi:3-hydroxybutyryl-CoA dehydrogenase
VVFFLKKMPPSRGPEMHGGLENRLTVAIIGAGPLGRWLALAAARAGFSVLLEDVMPANLHHAQEFLRGELGAELRAGGSLGASGKRKVRKAGPSTALRSAQDDKVQLGAQDDSANLAAQDDKRQLAAQDDSAMRVAFVSTIEEAVRGADLVVDCVPDELESKLEILWLLDRMAPPRTVLATPTTRLSIADLANCTYRPEKCIAIAVEASALTGDGGAGEIVLRTTARTAPGSVALVGRFWRRLGFDPRFELDEGE